MEIPKLSFLWQYLDHWSRLMPDEIAYHHEGFITSYTELEQSVNNLVNHLLAMGLEKGDRLVTILPSRPEFLMVYLAAGQIGAITTPFDVRYKMADLQRFLETSNPKVVISLAAAKENVIWSQLKIIAGDQKERKYFFIGYSDFGFDFSDLLSGRGNVSQIQEDARSKLKENEGSLIVFTGGTTGNPKGALLSHKNVTSMAYHEVVFLSDELRKAGAEGRLSSLAALPPSHVGGSVEFIGASFVGGYKIYFQDYWNPYHVLQLTEEAGIPWIGGVPTMYSILLSLPDLDQFDLSGVSLVLLSGERVTLELLNDIKERICNSIVNGYGSTEAGPELTFTIPEDDPKALAEGYVGKPLPTVKLKIVDDLGRELPVGRTGEVLAKSDFTIERYYMMPEEDEVGFDEDGFCLTGDLGCLNREGGLYLQGRKKHIIRVGSYTVMPTEVEEVALRLPQVAISAALGAPDKLYGEVVWLFVVVKESLDISVDQILNHMESQLANYKVPKRVVLRDSIPTTRIGKADRRALQQEMEASNWQP